MATTHAKPVLQQPSAPATPAVKYVWGVARIALGWVFLWAFVDKLFGFGFATPSAKSWINGGSPTTGFLKGTADHTFGGFFSGIAGNAFVDWLFMLGLAGIGVALVFGAGVRIAAITGTVLLVLMWAAELPLTNNPFVDDHLIYAVVLIGLALANAGDTLGIGRWWGQQHVVRAFPILK
jgi:thiosulfate dehydrogenase [quinone] large subunit